jgi:hypothetical protein
MTNMKRTGARLSIVFCLPWSFSTYLPVLPGTGTQEQALAESFAGGASFSTSTASRIKRVNRVID